MSDQRIDAIKAKLRELKEEDATYPTFADPSKIDPRKLEIDREIGDLNEELVTLIARNAQAAQAAKPAVVKTYPVNVGSVGGAASSSRTTDPDRIEDGRPLDK